MPNKPLQEMFSNDVENERWKYIAHDENGKVYVFAERPKLGSNGYEWVPKNMGSAYDKVSNLRDQGWPEGYSAGDFKRSLERIVRRDLVAKSGNRLSFSYLAKPDDRLQEVIIKASKVPDWANYVVLTKDGCIWASEEMPRLRPKGRAENHNDFYWDIEEHIMPYKTQHLDFACPQVETDIWKEHIYHVNVKPQSVNPADHVFYPTETSFVYDLSRSTAVNSSMARRALQFVKKVEARKGRDMATYGTHEDFLIVARFIQWIVSDAAVDHESATEVRKAFDLLEDRLENTDNKLAKVANEFFGLSL